MGTIISGTKCCQVVGFIHTTGGSFLNIVSLYSCPLEIIATICVIVTYCQCTVEPPLTDILYSGHLIITGQTVAVRIEFTLRVILNT